MLNQYKGKKYTFNKTEMGDGGLGGCERWGEGKGKRGGMADFGDI